MTHKDRFDRLGIKPPKGMARLRADKFFCCKGVLLYGPPGTGKTLLARACAAQVSMSLYQLTVPLCLDKSYVFKASRSSAGSNVYRRWGQVSARHFRFS